jgi:membrane protease YdiL (CAAX protease family)
MKLMMKHNIIFGIVLAFIFSGLFIVITIPLRNIITSSTLWRLISSIQRILFGIGELILYIKLFDKGHLRNVINFNNYKKALLAGIPLLLLTLFFTFYIIFGCEGFSKLNFWFIAFLILQQLATGFWEELTFRGYFMQGIIDKYGDKLVYRLLTCLIIGCIFGLLHAVESISWYDALNRFVKTGIMGVSFASIFLYSKNLLIPMILHAIYDIPANIVDLADIKNPLSTLLFGFYNALFWIELLVAIVIIVYPCIKDKKLKRQLVQAES